jgi:prevent-host-death family protein
MSEIGVRKLKQNASQVVAEAGAGAVITITVRGRPVARLGPLEATRTESLIASGRARPALRRLSELPGPVRRKRGQPRLSEELARMRRDERL